MASLIIEIDQKFVGTKELVETITVGRGADCGLQILASQISRSHLLLQKIGEGWQVVDLNSTNGTIIGNQRITAHHLVHGQMIRLGNVRITFCDPVAYAGATAFGDVTVFSPDKAAVNTAHTTANDHSWDDEVVKLVEESDDLSIDEEPIEDSINETNLAQLESLYPQNASLVESEVEDVEDREAEVEDQADAVSELEALAEPHSASQSHFDRVNLWDAANQPPMTYREISTRLSNSQTGDSLGTVAGAKDVHASGAGQRRSGSIVKEDCEYSSLIERFQEDAKFKIGTLFSVAAALLITGYLWMGGINTPAHKGFPTNASISGRPAMSKAQLRKLLADVPV